MAYDQNQPPSVPPPAGVPPPAAAPAAVGMANNSGQGPGAPVPAEIQGWSWAGFLMNWIWAIAHSAWIGLILCLLTGPVGPIVQGIKGNEWAWQNRRWESIQQFKDTQRVWVIWGLVLVGISVVIWIISAVAIGGAAVAINAGNLQ